MKKLYQFKIQLDGISPAIWRRLLIPSDLLLSDLHKVIQTTMGWENAHLHQFEKHDRFYLPRMQDDWTWNEMDNVDYAGMKVSDLLKEEQDSVNYEYDFGDSWNHSILLEKITDNPMGRKNPICLAGARNCPPEDCGGTWGYEHFLQVIGNPKHKEHDEILEWMGEDFDPEYFSADEVNNLLKRKDFGCNVFW